MIWKRYKRQFLLAFVLVLTLLAPVGCLGGKSKEQPKEAQEEQKEEQQEAEDTEDEEIYILLYYNAENLCVFVQNAQTGRQEEFSYNGGTYIRNRYGDSTTISQLQVGELVRLTYTEKKVLTEIAVAADAFLFENVTGFSIDKEEAILSLAGSNYYYDEELKVFSEDGIISLNDLSSQDTICIRGQEKKILTIVVDRGHGTVTFRNTELFEGGMISIGNVAAKKVTKDMRLEIPEGTYTLSVANDGYGGSKKITVNRFEELSVDLNELKGEGPRYCKLTFQVTPENAVVTIDGEEVDCSQVQELKYGNYKLKAEAEGYEPWKATLVVSSEEAEITIEMESQTDSEEEKEEEQEGSGDETGQPDADASGTQTGDSAGTGTTGGQAGNNGTGTGGTAGSSGTGTTGGQAGGSGTETTGSSTKTSSTSTETTRN